ncbi:MAG: hypothetical protein ACOY7J_23420 [Pseudomonadota bacterium]
MTDIAIPAPLLNAQRGRLNLSRYVGESVLIYPKPQHKNLPAQALFSAPIEVQFEKLADGCAHWRVTADKRLVVVRDEIYKRNSELFQPKSTWTDDAHRRAFFDIARENLDAATFQRFHEQALERAGC